MPMFNGSIFVNTSDYALLNADFEINSEYLRKMKETFISSPTKGFTTWPVSVKYSVSYRKIDNRYYLNHAKRQTCFLIKNKRKAVQ